MIDAIDVRDLVGHPGASREQPSPGTLEGLGDRARRACRDDAPSPATCCWSRWSRASSSPGTLRGTLSAALRPLPQGLRAAVRRRGPRAVRAPRPTRTPTTTRSTPRACSSSTRWSATRSGSSCPFSPLYRPDCQGLCPVCGGDRNLGECPGDHPEVDPRWAGLEQLLACPMEPNLTRRRRKESDTDGRPEEEAEQDARRQARARTGRRSRPRTASARSASSRSSRTACAATAATTPAGRPSRSSSRVTDRVPSRCRAEALDRALGVSFEDPELRETALTHRSFAFEHGRHGHERTAGVPRRFGARARRHRHGLPRRTRSCPRGRSRSCARRS